MRKKIHLNLKYIFVFMIMFFISCARKESLPFIKGIYGNPQTLLDAGYSFDELGMNAIFVRSISLTQDLYDKAKEQGCQIFVEFPTLLGRPYLQENPEAWPINQYGEPSPPADWFMGICPTDPDFIEYRSNQLKRILNTFNVDGIFLDYVHWHAQFETSDPILPETCFCDRCVEIFSHKFKLNIPGEVTSEKADWIFANADPQWRKWRSEGLNGWIDHMGDIVKQLKPEALLGIFYCAWYPADHDSALYRIMGIDVPALAARADVLSPMLFHKMKAREPAWVGEYTKWLGDLIRAGKPGAPLIWPIVQAHDSPGRVSAEELGSVLIAGSKPPSSGIMLFSDQPLIRDKEKADTVRKFYTQKF